MNYHDVAQDNSSNGIHVSKFMNLNITLSIVEFLKEWPMSIFRNVVLCTVEFIPKKRFYGCFIVS